MIVHKFKTSNSNGEPDFDMSVNFSCDLIDNNFIIKSHDVPEDKLNELKGKYEYLGQEEYIPTNSLLSV